jgi:hypothetical protein
MGGGAASGGEASRVAGVAATPGAIGGDVSGGIVPAPGGTATGGIDSYGRFESGNGGDENSGIRGAWAGAGRDVLLAGATFVVMGPVSIGARQKTA